MWIQMKNQKFLQLKDDAKDEPVVEVDGLEGVDTLGAPIRHLGQQKVFSRLGR